MAGGVTAAAVAGVAGVARGRSPRTSKDDVFASAGETSSGRRPRIKSRTYTGMDGMPTTSGLHSESTVKKAETVTEAAKQPSSLITAAVMSSSDKASSTTQ